MGGLTLSIVIITRNRPQLASDCLRQVLKQDYSPLEVVLVDSSDTDETKYVATTMPQVQYIRLENAARQMPRSRNEGIRGSRGEIVAFIDDDSIVQAEWAPCLAAHYSSPSVGGVGGLVLAPGETPLTHGVRPAVSKTGSVRGDFNWLSPGPIEVDHLMGCNMSFRRTALDAVGGFDSLFDASNFREETDVCVRVRKHGFRLIYDPKVAVVHLFATKEDFERDALKDKRYRYSITKNTTYFRLKNFGSMRTLLTLFLWGPLGTLVAEMRSHGFSGIPTAWNEWAARITGARTYWRHG